jgi:antitoxin component of MazEF toxin-antitoxin module
MVRKIFRTGDSIVVAIPREALSLLGLGEGDEVAVEVNEERQQIVISSMSLALPDIDREFACQVAAFIEEYRPALNSLARQRNPSLSLRCVFCTPALFLLERQDGARASRSHRAVSPDAAAGACQFCFLVDKSLWLW